MNCTSIHECRTESFGMTLTFLPQFSIKNAENSEDWNLIFRENIHSLHAFDFYIKELIRVADDTSLSQIADEHLTDVVNLLHQFFIHFKSHMEARICYNMDSIPTQPSLCVDCVRPQLPSRALEVTRNYLFLLQFHDFLDEFYKLYLKFFAHETRFVSNC